MLFYQDYTVLVVSGLRENIFTDIFIVGRGGGTFMNKINYSHFVHMRARTRTHPSQSCMYMTISILETTCICTFFGSILNFFLPTDICFVFGLFLLKKANKIYNNVLQLKSSVNVFRTTSIRILHFTEWK